MGRCLQEALALVRAPAQGSRLQHRLAVDSSPRLALRGRLPDHRAPVPAPAPARVPVPAPAGKRVSWRPQRGEGGELQPGVRAGACAPVI